MLARTSYQLYAMFGLMCCCIIAAIVFNNTMILTLPFAVTIGLLLVQRFIWLWLALIASIAFSTETSVTDTLSLDIPDEPLMLLTTGITLALFAAKKITITSRFWKSKIVLLLILLLIWCFISAFFSTRPLLSFKYLIAKIWFLIPFVIVPQFLFSQPTILRKFGMLLIVSVAITVVYVIYQHSKFGFLFDNVNNAVVPFYRNHVNYSALVVSVMPLLYIAWKYTAIKKHKNIVIVTSALFFLGLALSYSRGAWLALAVGIVAYWLTKKGVLAYTFLISISLCFGLVFWLSNNNKYLHYHGSYRTVIYHENFKDHWRATFTGNDMSNAERFNRWIAGAQMVSENKLTGFGPSTFYSNYKPYIITPFKTWVSDNPEKSTVHNYFLLTLIEQGWVGFILLIALLYATLRAAETVFKKSSNPLNKDIALITAGILSIVLTLNMLSDLIETDKIGSMFYLCIGTIIWLYTNLNYKISEK